jgi:glucan phosphoethanolaminetransferase (alkaline phosphatase superfamily)
MIERDNENRRFYQSKPFIYASFFCIGLTLFELVFLHKNPELGILTKHFANGDYLRLLIVLFISLASIILSLLFFYAALASPFRYRIGYFMFFCVLILTEYNYYKAFRRFSEFQDAEIAFFSTNWQIISNAAVLYFNYLALIPIIVFGVLLIRSERVWKKGLTAFACVLLATGAFFFVTSYFTKNAFYTISFGAGCRTFVNFPTAWFAGSYYETPRSISYSAAREKLDFQTSGAPNNNIVFIVDESFRADHLSLNGYDKPTTPFLDELKRKNLIKNWGIAASGTTCSGTSNNLMLTGLNELPDYDNKVYKLPTIFQYAKAMNYKTYYIDGQVSGLWNGKPSDIPDFGEWIKESDLIGKVQNKYEIDGEIARKIKEITSNTTGNFIWVNKYGVHKPYTNSYPNSENKKDNYVITYNPEIDKELLRNQYDEAILYNSQAFFAELLGDGLAANTFYIYTSDHGQTLSENGEVVSHCSTTRNEAVVPLFIISEPTALPAVDTNYRASHSNIFATLLDLMGVLENTRKYNYSPSLLKAKAADSQPRFYYAGDLQGKDESRKYPFD